MYRVEYTKLVLMKDEVPGNIPQRAGVAYMNCTLEHVETKLRVYLIAERKEGKSFYPVIESIKRIHGHIVN